MESASRKLLLAWWVLRIAYGLLFILVGVDKFFNILTDWSHLMSPWIHSLLILRLFGMVQILAGILLFTPWMKVGIYLILALLGTIFLNLLAVNWDLIIIVHDIFMMVQVYVLLQLTRVLNKG